MPILDSDFIAVDEIVKADPDWRAAMARRGYDDVSKIRACPITAGAFGVADDDRRRMVRVLAFVQAGEHDLAWAHPVDGIAAYVDLIEKKVFKITDEFELPVPAESGDYDDEAVRGPHRTTLQAHRDHPAGRPELHAGRPRAALAGLVDADRLRRPRRADPAPDRPARGGRERPVIYRASIPEMVVPYGDPQFRYWQAYFDTGEYLVGKWANSLELGCDCLGEIAYLDATVTDDTGQPRTIPNAICIHEEDFGILWKHTDIFNGSAQSRRQRRLVVSYFTTVGNYDYGFYWYFYLDGTIECEIKATGVLFTSAYPGGDHPYSTEVAPGLAAPVHQHLFSARLDMTVDGLANAVEEVDVSGLPIGPDNPYGNAIVQQVTRLTRESQAGRRADGSRGRTWRVISTEQREPVRPARPATRSTRSPRRCCWPIRPRRWRRGPGSRPTTSGSPGTTRITLFGRRLREPASPAEPGIPAFIAADQDIDGADIVVWHTFGPTHCPAPGGLAGHAGRPLRLRAQADRLLRPQPDPGRAAPAPHCSPG